MLSGTLGTILLINLLTGRGIYRAGEAKGAVVTRQSRGKGINRAEEGTVRAVYGCPSSSASPIKMDF